MNELARRSIEALRGGASATSALATAGSGDPAEDAAALGRAARHPDLAPQLEHWVPALLTSARPGFGARQLAAIATERRHRGRPLDDLHERPLLPRLLGDSNFLARWLVREPDWVDDLAGPLPPPPAAPPPDADWEALRRAKYRGLLCVAGRDLGARPFEDGLGELSRLADAVLVRGLALATTEGEPPALFALGKLGGNELNFSSDVDLLFVCDAPPDERGHVVREAAARTVQELKRRLEERTEAGFGYRVDLDLRPEGPPGPLVRSVDATLAYYELRGAEWERQMLLRLRPVAGSRAAREAFVRGIEPFVYRRSIDPGVIRSVRAMKDRIERERRAAGRDLESNLKETPGGIRDVEFTVQALQLFHAGRNPALRTGNVLDALGALEAGGLVPKESAEALRAGYVWLRRAEHALQLAEEQQTARVPRDAGDRIALARRMGYREAEGEAALERWRTDRERVHARVREQFEALVLGEASP